MSEVEHRPISEEPEAPARKLYEKPEVVYEARLEVRAGSPLMSPPIDPFDLEDIFGP